MFVSWGSKGQRVDLGSILMSYLDLGQGCVRFHAGSLIGGCLKYMGSKGSNGVALRGVPYLLFRQC